MCVTWIEYHWQIVYSEYLGINKNVQRIKYFASHLMGNIII